MVTQEQIIELYLAMFQRAPTQEEVEQWHEKYKDDEAATMNEVANDMFDAAVQAVSLFGLEDLYPQYAQIDLNNLSGSEDKIKDIIESVYETLLGKSYEDDPEGIDSWVESIVSGEKSIGDAVAGIVYITEQIAKNPETYKDVLGEEYENAVQAAEKFELKVEAAKEITNKIQKLKSVDEESLKKMHDVLEKINSKEDLNKIDEILAADFEKNDNLDQTVPLEDLQEHAIDDIDMSTVVKIDENENSYVKNESDFHHPDDVENDGLLNEDIHSDIDYTEFGG